MTKRVGAVVTPLSPPRTMSVTSVTSLRLVTLESFAHPLLLAEVFICMESVQPIRFVVFFFRLSPGIDLAR